MFNKILTTCNVYTEDKKEGSIIIGCKGTIKEYQTVEAVGSSVRDIKVGDIVMIDPKRYIVQKHNEKEKSIKGVIGDNMTLGVQFPIVHFNDEKHLLIYDQDVDYIIEGEEEPEPSLVLPQKNLVV